MKVQKEEIRTGSIPGRGAGERRHGVGIFRQSGGELGGDRILGKYERRLGGRLTYLISYRVSILIDTG
jgi:hypothetical protein